MSRSPCENLLLVRHIKQMRLVIRGILRPGMAFSIAAIAAKAGEISVMDAGLSSDELFDLVDLAVRIYEGEFVRNGNGMISLRK